MEVAAPSRWSPTRRRCLTLIALVFLVHGALYFLTPESVQDEQSALKLLKYFLLVLYAIVAWPRVPFPRLAWTAVLMAVLAFFHFTGVEEPKFINLVQYLAPLSVLVLYDHIRPLNFRWLAIITLVVSSILTYVEVWVIRGLYRNYYVAGAYRATSIFVSPNVLGPMVALLTYFLILRFHEEGRRAKLDTARDLVMVGNAVAIIVLSGSKTGMMVGAALAGVFLISRSGARRNHVIGFGFAGLAVVLLLQLAGVQILNGLLNAFTVSDGSFGTLKVREVSFRSGYDRLREYRIFLDMAADTPLFPWFHGYAYIDNAYLHVWGMFGLATLVAFVVFNGVLVLLALRTGQKTATITMGLFLMMGLTTNFAFLWPLSYIYWYVVMDIVTAARRGNAAAVAARHFEPAPVFATR